MEHATLDRAAERDSAGHAYLRARRADFADTMPVVIGVRPHGGGCRQPDGGARDERHGWLSPAIGALLLVASGGITGWALVQAWRWAWAALQGWLS